jgi:hypothetical protein
VAEFDPESILRVLVSEEVDFVVIGGLAAILRGSSLPTEDIDVLPARDRPNLDRLGRALASLNARIRTGGEAVAAPLDGAFLDSMPHMLNLTTDSGDIDLIFEAAGDLRGFADWVTNAEEIPLDADLTILVASLDDVIGSKSAAGRPKDLMALPYLESLRDAINTSADEPHTPG